MRLLSVLALLCIVSGAGEALADPVAIPLAPGCDFFQAQLIGLLCGGTGYVAPGVSGGDLTIDRTTTTHAGFGHSRFSTTDQQHWDYRNTFEDATFAISPWQGLRFHITGEAHQYEDGYSLDVQQTGGGGFHNAGGSVHSTVTGSYAGWESAGVEATIWDAKTASGRYVLNLAGGAGFLPGGGVYRGRDRFQIGWESGAQWVLGGSGLSLDYHSISMLQRYDNPGENRLESEYRLLLTSDSYGVAFGPRLEQTTELWHAPGVNTGWFAASLGGEALLEPFRATQLPVLHDMTLDLSATYALGQAGLVPSWMGTARGWDYAAVARINFRY